MTVLDQERYLASLPFSGDSMSKEKFVKDIPLGVLMLVLSQFLFYGANYFANFPKWYEMAGIVFCTLIASDMINFGLRLIKGFEVDKPE
jgi:hypothetical protein